MKNKKKLYQLLFIVILSCTGTSLSAQGAYLKVGGGYAWGVGKAPINSYFQREILVGNYNFLLIEQAMINLKDSGMEVVKGSFGKGFNAGISGGYMFSKHMGIELGISYFIGKEVESTWDIPSEKLFLTEAGGWQEIDRNQDISKIISIYY